MTSSRPYLVRALYDWISDNDMTPHVLVDALQDGVSVPDEYVKDGKVTLNVSTGAVSDLVLGNESIEFNARFSGLKKNIYLPIESLLAIYARENGQGMMFPENENDDPSPDTPPQPQSKTAHLKVVK